jgi:hypothetical protein
MLLAGYAGRQQPFTRVDHRLYAKAMAIQDHAGNRALLITADIIGFPATVTEPICAAISKQTGLRRDQILLNASHTHSGPIVTRDLKMDMPDEQRQRIKANTDRLEKIVIQIGIDAWQDLQPARLAWGRGVANFAMNRREFTDRGVRLGVNPAGTVDRSVPVLRVNNPDGSLRAAVFGYACHGTTITNKSLAISADYAGFAQDTIEQAFPNAQSMFIMGCAGDTNPYPRLVEGIEKTHGKELGDEVVRLVNTDLKKLNGPIRTAFEHVDLSLQPLMTRAEAEALAKSGSSSWLRYVASESIKMIEQGKTIPKTFPAPMAAWRFGDSLTLIGISGEVVVEYVRLTEDAIGPRDLWVAGYCNDVYGYLPSKRILREGGYETRGLYRAGVGLFAPEAQDQTIESIKRLAKKVGRTPE